MSAQKTKSAPADGPASGKGAKTTPTSTVPPSPVFKPAEADGPTTTVSGKPDKNAFDAEQQRIKSEIDTLQVKLAVVREKISTSSSATKSSSGNDRRTTLRAELDGIRDQQSSCKTSRGQVLDQLKTLQDGIQKKSKDLQAARGKTPFRTVAEVDAHISILDKQVESGTMKLADEKRALQEISQSKRTRKLVEGFQAVQDSIDADRSTADELRGQLDDPESKAISDRYDAIKAELDELKKEADEAYAGRTKLFEERDGLQAQINTLFTEKRASAQQFREANDQYWTKVNEDRARRAERARAQRAAEEAQKKLELAERLREEASLPAFQVEIEDCQTLMDALSGKTTGNVVLSSVSLLARAEVAGVPKLEPRQVEAVGVGLVARKKKGEEEQTYFMGKGKKGKKDKTAKSASESDSLKNLPFGTITALSKLAIPLPTAPSDTPRVIEDLKAKKAWFEANQARVTAENIAEAEARIQRLTNSAKAQNQNGSPTTEETRGPNNSSNPSLDSASVLGDAVAAVPDQEAAEDLDEVATGDE
ncbi:nuclear segregation protein Bfr1 [Gyrodon lividus]|nr:nuclear segregation protein Bfr1 [Gyrodon lividus]